MFHILAVTVNKNCQRAGAPLLWGKADKVEVVQPKEDSRETILVAFWYLKGAYKKMGRDFLVGSLATGWGVMVLN